MAYNQKNQKNQKYAKQMLAIDKVMLSSLKGRDLTEYMEFRAETGKALHQRETTPRRAYQKLVLYSEEHLKLREDNVQRGIERILSDAEEAVYQEGGLRIVTERQLIAAAESVD